LKLGIPTANIPIEGLSIGGHSDLPSGIYYGWCTLDLSAAASSPSTPAHTSPQSSNHAVADLESTPHDSALSNSGSKPSRTVYPTVLSIGFNPFYANTHRSIEIHILHQFAQDFYGANLSLIILGYIRPEYDYVSKEALVEDIREDIRVAKRSLDRADYLRWKEDEWLIGAADPPKEGEGEGDGPRNKSFGRGQIDSVAKCEMMP
jgi:riboflavin kinase